MTTKNAQERNRFSLSFFINRSKLKKKTGEAPILARISIGGEKKSFITNIDIDPNLWDVSANAPKKRCSIAADINNKLRAIETKLEDDYQFVFNRDGYVTPETLKNYFQGNDIKSNSLLQVFDEHLKELEELIPTGDLSYSTFKKYRKTRERLEKFMIQKYQVSDMSMRNISIVFWDNFIHYLRTTWELSTNVLAKNAQLFKKVVTIAHQKGIITVHPFPNATIKKERKDRECLTMSEVNRIISHDFSKCERLEHIRDIFIFSCFTGIEEKKRRRENKGNRLIVRNE